MMNQPNKKSAPDRSWDEATILFNGKPVLPNQTIALFYGEDSTFEIEAAPEVAEEIYLAVVDNNEGVKLLVEPKLESWHELVAGKLSYKISPEIGKSGALVFVLMSRQLNMPLEIPCQVMSPKPIEQLVIRVNGEELKSGDVVYAVRNRSNLIEVEPFPGSPLIRQKIVLSSDAVTPPNLGAVFEPPEGSQALNPIARWNLNCGDDTDGNLSIKLSLESSPQEFIHLPVDVGYQDGGVRLTTIILQTVGNSKTLTTRSMKGTQLKKGVQVEWLGADGSRLKLEYTGENAFSSIQFKQGELVGVITARIFVRGKPSSPRTINIV
ncbi:hypothetical protein IB254_03760 [Pseudomonas sp. PDM03]|uniref:hypothetical protein n=1 Tax=Pseudomonas sp. PDM03 TaxID=2769266 RepID=UPI00178505BF|nr:hypothetical protein [Pseudomonas sp. PDM03]MBD9586168.1 hypothetical protein [Pseudomonas sp. PDM03]